MLEYKSYISQSRCRPHCTKYTRSDHKFKLSNMGPRSSKQQAETITEDTMSDSLFSVIYLHMSTQLREP